MSVNFEMASRKHYRYPYNGMISTEDLWELNVSQLDFIFKKLKAQSRQAQEESLLTTKTQEDVDTENKIDIIRYIVEYKQNLQKEAEMAMERKQQRARIKEILYERENADLRNKTPEELRAMLDELGK